MTAPCEKSEKSNNQQRNMASYIPLVTLTFSAKEPKRKSIKNIYDNSKVPQNKITCAAASIPKNELQNVSQKC
jgi:hypothetical protein